MPHDSITTLSARLNNLTEFELSPEEYAEAEARLREHAKKLGMEHQFFPGSHVSAPSAQAKVKEAVKKLRRLR